MTVVTDITGNDGPFFYSVLAQRPTAVDFLAVGNFTHPSVRNLILAKSSFLEIREITAQGLLPYYEVPIYGKIAAIFLFRPDNFQKDLLFIITERYDFCVLKYSSSTKELITVSSGSAQDCVGYPADCGVLAAVDPFCRMICLHIYNGVLKILPTNASTGQLSEAYNVRLDVPNVLDIKFSYASTKPTIIVLYRDFLGRTNVATYEVDVREKDLTPGPWEHSDVEDGAAILIPVPPPLKGCLILGEQLITHHKDRQGRFNSAAVNSTYMKCYCQVDADGHRYLLSDYLGRMYVVKLFENEIKVELLGKTSSPSAISYLDNGYVYVGSKMGDSWLVKLENKRNEHNSFLTIVAKEGNLGPIVDFCALDYDGLGQDQIVTCSGGDADGSLKIMLNSLGVHHMAALRLDGLTDLWAIKRQSALYDDLLCLNFTSRTAILSITGEFEELSPESVPGFLCTVTSLYCGAIVGNRMLQVTERSARVIGPQFELIREWTPEDESRITKVACNGRELVLVLGRRLVHLNLETWQSKSADCEHEVACVSVRAVSEGDTCLEYCAVGLWEEACVVVYKLPELSVLTKRSIGGGPLFL
jgi:DNA damage-binding protein 1